MAMQTVEDNSRSGPRPDHLAQKVQNIKVVQN